MTENQYYGLFHHIQFWAILLLASVSDGWVVALYLVLAVISFVISASYSSRVWGEFKNKEIKQIEENYYDRTN